MDIVKTHLKTGQSIYLSNDFIGTIEKITRKHLILRFHVDPPLILTIPRDVIQAVAWEKGHLERPLILLEDEYWEWEILPALRDRVPVPSKRRLIH